MLNGPVKSVTRPFFVTKPSDATRTCGKFCGDVLNSVEQQTYSDEEIIHLALLNAGYGIADLKKKYRGLTNIILVEVTLD